VTIPAGVQAAWVHLFDDTLKTTAGIHRLIDEAATAGVNTLIVQVARRHDAYYNSDVLPRTTDDTLEANLDVLATVLARAKQHGIAVHAWYGIAPTWHAVYEALPAPSSDWIALAHGRDAPVDERWVSRRADGTWTEYLDMGVPAVREHVVAVVDELVSRYALDGIHLDYVRYAGGDTGYNPVALNAYQQDTATTTTPRPNDPSFVAWRRAAVTRLVADVHAVTARQGVLLSAAVITWGAPPRDGNLAATRTGTDALQPWDEWLAQDILDVALPMNYFRSHQTDQADWFVDWLAYQADLDRRVNGHVVSGVGGYLNSVSNARRQLALAVQSTGSAAIYSWQQPTSEDADLFRQALATSGWG
jgi:uncharacterized lipoprotein YddW (UPF0748 family)